MLYTTNLLAISCRFTFTSLTQQQLTLCLCNSTTALVHLLQNQLATSSATLQLYSTLTLLLSPILHQPLAPIPPIASYLSKHLLPALTSNEDSAALQHQLADIILDLVWQLDTQIDSAILRRPTSTVDEQQQQQQQQQPKAKEEDAMQVDEQQQQEGATKEAKSEQSEEDKKAAEAAKAKDEAARFLKLETAARERLAEFVKLLIVRPAIPWRAAELKRLQS